MHERSKTGPRLVSFVFRRGNNQFMRKLTLTLTVVAALGAPGVANAATKGINIYGSGFSPKSATITQNDTVIWTNRDSVNHQVLATHGEFVSPILKPGKSFSFTFTAAKTYGYSDELHPKLTGSITVKGLPPSLTLGVSQPVVTAGRTGQRGWITVYAAGQSHWAPGYFTALALDRGRPAARRPVRRATRR